VPHRWVGVFAAMLTGGCDFGPATDSPGLGPALEIVSSRPAEDSGLDCARDSSSCGFPADAPFVFRFNRHLDPSTAVRQSLAIYAGTAEQALFLQPTYDAIERTVSYSHPDGLLARGLVYTIEFVEPEAAGDFGFRAYDATPLVAAALPLEYSFRARAAQAVTSPTDASSGSCRTAVEIMRSSCADTGCHAGCSGSTCRRQPPMGLRLDSIEAIAQTAIDRVAHETTRGQSATTALQGPDRFGVQMPIVDPARPDNSFLLYKLLVAPNSYRDEDGPACTSRLLGDLPPTDCLMPSDSERDRLRAWLVPGDPMPPSGHALAVESPIDALRSLQSWIRSGASTIECTE
jgi:hypothetical protein